MCIDELIEKFSKGLLKRNMGVEIPPSVSAVSQRRLIGDYLKIKAEYRKELMLNMRDVMSGKLTKDEFIEKQKQAIKYAYTEAYSLGKAFGTGGNSAITDTERRFLVYQVTKEVGFMSGFASDLLSQSGTLPYGKRMDMYVTGLDAVFGFGRLVYMPEDVTIIWQLGYTDKHCVDCLMIAKGNPYTKKTLPTYPKAGGSRCFVGKRNSYKILTIDGWKNFNEIKVGDLVLSHQGKWKKVLNIIDEQCQDEFCYEIILETKENKRPLKFYMLNDHKSICDGKWTVAEDLKVGDRLLLIGHPCKHCGKVITYDDHRSLNAEYCSQSCSSTAIAYNKTLIRFWEDDIKNNVDFVKNKLSLLLKNHNGEFKGKYRKIISIKKVKTDDVIGGRVLSLTVEDHESYVVQGGLIAHNCLSNCRCSLNYFYKNNLTSSEYDNFILNQQNTRKEIPSEEQYKTMVGFKESFYFNRLQYDLTKDKFYQDEYKRNIKELRDYTKLNNLVFPTSFPVKQQLAELKLFNKNVKFQLFKNPVDLKEGQLVAVLNNGTAKYGKVFNTLGGEVQVVFLDKTQMAIDFTKSIIFGEV